MILYVFIVSTKRVLITENQCQEYYCLELKKKEEMIKIINLAIIANSVGLDCSDFAEPVGV